MVRRPEELVRPEILALKAYHVADAEDVVKLDAMENPYAMPEDLRRALAARLARVAILKPARTSRSPLPTSRNSRPVRA